MGELIDLSDSTGIHHSRACSNQNRAMSDLAVAHDTVGLPEAAKVLGVHRATVNDMVVSGRLPAERDGAHWRVQRADLLAFAESYVKPANAPATRDRRLPASASDILDLLESWEAANAEELAPLLELHPGNVRKHLRLMEHEGLVSRRADGQWVMR